MWKCVSSDILPQECLYKNRKKKIFNNPVNIKKKIIFQKMIRTNSILSFSKISFIFENKKNHFL